MSTKNSPECGVGGGNGRTCSSRWNCTPCVFIWGAALVLMMLMYFIRY